MLRKALLTIVALIAIFPVLYVGLASSIVCEEGTGSDDCGFSALEALGGAGVGLLFGTLPAIFALCVVILPIVWVWRKMDRIRIGGKRDK